jgi:hypothetical protein
VRSGGLQGTHGCDDIPPVVESDYVCRIKMIEFIDFFAVFDIDVPAQALAENARAQFKHFVKDVAELVSVQPIYYDDHGFPLRVVVR